MPPLGPASIFMVQILQSLWLLMNPVEGRGMRSLLM
ncbi:hypothetical protein AAZX31_01G100900 [Glycine max]